MTAILQPQAATALERGLAGASARIGDVPVPIRDLWSPWRCPAEHLAFLAWALSVDIWNEAWPEQRKRWVIAESLALHRIKGTLEGVRRHLALADARLLRVWRPPGKAFLTRARTPEERRAWLAQYPQLRIYPYRNRGSRHRFGAHLGSSRIKVFLRDEQDEPARLTFLRRSDSDARFGRQAFYFDPLEGSLARMSWLERRALTRTGEAVEFERVGKRGRRGRRTFLGASLLRRTHLVSAAGSAARVYTVRVERTYEFQDEVRELRAVAPSLAPIDIRPEPVAERGVAPRRAALIGRPLRRLFTLRSSAHERIFDATWLFDPERPLPLSGAKSFLGHVRLGIAPFTAEIETAIRRPSHRRIATLGRAHHKMFLRSPSRETVRRVARATRAGKSARDRILIDTTTTRPIEGRDLDTISDSHRFIDTVRS